MKHFIITFIALLFSIVANADGRTIHWLTFIDTTDEWYDGMGRKRGIGEADKNTREILNSRWIDIVNASLKEYGYTPNPIDIYGTDLSPEKCREVIKNLHCGSKDIVVFYYIGHGTENTGASIFPLMFMGMKIKTQEDLKRLVDQEGVHRALMEKGARLTITIAMCCNVSQGVPGKITPTFSLNYGNTYVNAETAESIKKMFLEYKGNLCVTSSSPGESSYGGMSSLGPTDYFTYNWIDQFNCVLPGISNPSWETMLGKVQDAVSNAVERDEALQKEYPGAKQTPIWESFDGGQKLVKTERISKSTLQQPTPPKPEPDEKAILKAELDNALAYISASNVDRTQRKAIAQKIKGAFTSDLVIRIVSQDGDVVVDKEPIGTFLDRIATDPGILMNVSVAELDINSNGQIYMLSVRETYKKKSNKKTLFIKQQEL